MEADLQSALVPDDEAFDRWFVRSQIAALGAIKRAINDTLIGCAANGNLKMTLRFVRSHHAPDGGGEQGIVPDLLSLQAMTHEAPGDW